jgi:hypothetical protein
LWAAEAFFWCLAEVIHFVLDLVTLSLSCSKLLLVDGNHALLLPGIVPHLVQLWPQLSNLSVDLANALLQIIVLALVCLKGTPDLAMLILKILNSAFNHSKIMLQLASLTA